MHLSLILSLLIVSYSFSSSNFTTTLKKNIKDYNLSSEEVGFLVYDINKKKIDYSYNEGETFYPASVYKMLTAYYILETLGPNKELKTKLYYTGKIKNNILYGDIIYHSEGDPYLLSNDFIDMAYSLKSLGIKKVEGHFKVYQNLPSFDKISDIGLDDQPYNQSISSINVNFNRFKAIRSHKSYFSLPAFEYLQIVKTKDSFSPGLIFSRNIENKNTEQWFSNITNKWYYEVPVRTSHIYNSHYFLHLLERSGVEHSGKVSFITNMPNKKTMTYQKDSLPISRLIELGMEYSNNFFMEILLLVATKKDSLKLASLEMKKFYLKEFKDLDFQKVNFDRASGLTLQTQFPLGLIERFLAKTYLKKFNHKYFMSYFSLAGTGGFLARKFLNSTTHERFFAKTGSMDYVNNICGIIIQDNEKAFCLYTNNKKLRIKLQGKNSNELERLRQEAKKWYKKTSQFSEVVLTNYLNTMK